MNDENTAAPANPSAPPAHDSSPKDSSAEGATVLVRGEMVRDQQRTDGSKDSQQRSEASQSQDAPPKNPKPKEKEKSPPKVVSAAKAQLQSRLPLLEDDSAVGVEKSHVVTRDGKADLSFHGTLLASAAPSSAPKGTWQEYRVYATTGGKHVFSKSTRTVFAEDQDRHEAEVFDDSPSSVSSQLLRSARDLARTRPLAWTDAATAYFGYDPLAKALYRKLSGQFEEHIT